VREAVPGAPQDAVSPRRRSSSGSITGTSPDRKRERGFRGFLYERAWTHAEGTVALFTPTVTWLRKNPEFR
jgi:hypothetical protein